MFQATESNYRKSLGAVYKKKKGRKNQEAV